MGAIVALFSLAVSAVVAVPASAPVAERDFSPVVRALQALAPAADAHLERRQSSSAAIQGLGDLLQKAVAGQSGGKCSSECSDWVNSVYKCADLGSYTQIGMCACGSDETAEMQTCGRCYGGSDAQGATAFANYCSSALDAVSSFSSRTASATAAGSASASSRGSSGFASAASATSAGAGTGSSIASGILSDINSATSRAPQTSASGSSNPIQGGGSGAGTLKAGGALVAAVIGGAMAAIVL